MHRTQLYLKQNQIVELKKLCRKEEITLSELVRRYIDTFLKKEKSTLRDHKSIYMELLPVIRKAEKLHSNTPKDLSKSIDKYLYEK